MILERTNNEVLVRLPATFDLSELQNILDYIKFKELVSNSKAEQQDADMLSTDINQSIWQKFKAKRQRK